MKDKVMKEIFKLIVVIFGTMLMAILYLFALNGRYVKIGEEDCLFDKWTGTKIDYYHILEKEHIGYNSKDSMENM